MNAKQRAYDVEVQKNNRAAYISQLMRQIRNWENEKKAINLHSTTGKKAYATIRKNVDLSLMYVCNTHISLVK